MHPSCARQTCPDNAAFIEEIRLAMNAGITLNNWEMEAAIYGDFAILPTIKGELVEAGNGRTLC
jgi:hypothetical protein